MYMKKCDIQKIPLILLAIIFSSCAKNSTDPDGLMACMIHKYHIAGSLEIGQEKEKGMTIEDHDEMDIYFHTWRVRAPKGKYHFISISSEYDMKVELYKVIDMSYVPVNLMRLWYEDPDPSDHLTMISRGLNSESEYWLRIELSVPDSGSLPAQYTIISSYVD